MFISLNRMYMKNNIKRTNQLNWFAKGGTQMIERAMLQRSKVFSAQKMWKKRKTNGT